MRLVLLTGQPFGKHFKKQNTHLDFKVLATWQPFRKTQTKTLNDVNFLPSWRPQKTINKKTTKHNKTWISKCCPPLSPLEKQKNKYPPLKKTLISSLAHLERRLRGQHSEINASFWCYAYLVFFQRAARWARL
jgi:hypothetical protein